MDKTELNFEAIHYDLSFDLNGALGFTPTTQSLVERATGTAIDNPIRGGIALKNGIKHQIEEGWNG